MAHVKPIVILNVKSDNVLTANDENFVNILVNLEETRINISHINENSNDMNNTELGGFSTTNSITTDERYINRATSTDGGRISGFLCSKTVLNLSHKILTETYISVGERVRFCSRLKNS